MAIRLFMALISGMVWLLFVPEPSLSAFIVGFVIGLGILILLRLKLPAIRWNSLPAQFVALVVYSVTLYRDIVLSSIEVARRVLSRDPALKPGFIRASIDNPEGSLWLAALTGSAVSLTPGELVVEIEGFDNFTVHALDTEVTEPRLPEELRQRQQLLERVMGRG